jgi:hypothetical protein
VRIELSAEGLKAGTTEQQLVYRARVILASAQGLDLSEVVCQSGLSRPNCSIWRTGFVAGRLPGLHGRPGRRFPDHQPGVAPATRFFKYTLSANTPASTCISSWATWPPPGTRKLQLGPARSSVIGPFHVHLCLLVQPGGIPVQHLHPELNPRRHLALLEESVGDVKSCYIKLMFTGGYFSRQSDLVSGFQENEIDSRTG